MKFRLVSNVFRRKPSGNRRWVPLTVRSAPAERNRVSLSSFYFNCVHTPEFYPKTQLTGSNHLILKLKLRSLTPMWMNSASRLMSRTFQLPNLNLVPCFSQPWAQLQQTQQRRLPWSLKTLIWFQRRKIQPTYLQPGLRKDAWSGTLGPWCDSEGGNYGPPI